MGDIIDDLMDFVLEVFLQFVFWEFDMFLMMGEWQFVVLFVMVLFDVGILVCLYIGFQVGVIMIVVYGNVCIIDIIFG